jgi:hypothetical protein
MSIVTNQVRGLMDDGAEWRMDTWDAGCVACVDQSSLCDGMGDLT